MNKRMRALSQMNLLIVMIFCCSCSSSKLTDDIATGLPQVYDERLELSLFAENPDIVTPIGIAIDDLDRIFVLESHTHLPPADYNGPEGDVIKIFQDADQNGRPDDVSVFAEGFHEGVNMAFSPEGVLYLVTSKAVWALYDRDGDGKCDEKVSVVDMVEPDYVYAHAALLGVTFSTDGWMYVSRGNTGGSPWMMVGTDGSSVSGYGDGGNIVRAKYDGSELEEMATGFWNPIDLKFDDYGRLMVADNDPDSRGPNKLVHAIKGGDYGYKTLFGESGIHPYLAWNGELAGTLPYAVGLGEAPSGLFNTSLASLPKDYNGEILATIWEESKIVRIKFQDRGVSLCGVSETIIEGGDEFRPVAFDADKNGAIYFTDWVQRDYPNHGRGKIWKLSTKANVATTTPSKKYTKKKAGSSEQAINELLRSESISDFNTLKDALKSDDSFIQNTAIQSLTRPVFLNQVVEATSDEDPSVRLGALIALQRSGYENPKPVLQALSDPDERIRQRALIYAGTNGIISLASELERVFAAEQTSALLFETYLETVKLLQPEFQENQKKKKESAKQLPRQLPPDFIENFISDRSRPEKLRSYGIRYLSSSEGTQKLLLSLLKESKDPAMTLEIIRSLSSIQNEAAATQLLKLASEPSYSLQIRSEAILALSRQSSKFADQVVTFLKDPAADVRIEALRYLRTKLSSDKLQEVMKAGLLSSEENDKPFSQQVKLVSLHANAGEVNDTRPESLADWEKAVASGGDPVRGRRVFFSSQSMCSNCHTAEGRGGDLGPDLSNVGLSKTRSQLLISIIKPSEEVTPEWQGWYVKLKDGKSYYGRQIDVGGEAIDLYTQSQGFMKFKKADIEDYGMTKNSLMPEGLEKQLTEADMQDLIAFLEVNK